MDLVNETNEIGREIAMSLEMQQQQLDTLEGLLLPLTYFSCFFNFEDSSNVILTL